MQCEAYFAEAHFHSVKLWRKNIEKKRKNKIKKVLTKVGVDYIINKSVDERKHDKEFGIIAQLGEHLPYKQGVTGSSPVGPITRTKLVDN